MSQPLPSWIVAFTIFVMTGIFGLSVSVWQERSSTPQEPVRFATFFKPANSLPHPTAGNAKTEVVTEGASAEKLVDTSDYIAATDAEPRLEPPASGEEGAERELDLAGRATDPVIVWMRTRAAEWLVEFRSAASSVAKNASYARRPEPPNAPRVSPPQPIAAEPRVPAIWPDSESLLEPLVEFEANTPRPAWTADVRDSLEQLTKLETIHDDRVPALLGRLAQIAEQLRIDSRAAIEQSPGHSDVPSAANCSRYSYELHRRVEVWREVHGLAKSRLLHVPAKTSPYQSVAFGRWEFSQVDPAWREYLALDELVAGAAKPRLAARRVLSRFHSVLMSPAQQAAVEKWIGPEQLQWLRGAAASPIDLSQLLRDLEAFHREITGFTEAQLNDQYQDLLWCGEPDARGLIQALENHYRNANVRIAISETALNRLLAGSHTFQEPVRDQIMGANVSGRSQITNQLSVQLIPDEVRWSLVLTTKGDVRSRTQAHRDGFVIHSVGSANVVGSKRIHLSQSEVTTEAPQIDAVTDNQVIGLDSPYDDIPLIGWTARRVAQRKQQSAEGEVETIVRSRIRSRVQERMEQAVTEALQKAQSEFNRWVTARFLRWGLEPQPVEMSTSDDELVVRYRLAGFDHLGATTPRPLIEGKSAVSLQLHESAVNNVLSRLDVAGTSFTLESLIAHLESKLQTSLGEPSEAEHQVELEFAPYDPIRIEFDDEFIQVSLHLRELVLDRGKSWKKITLRTKYAVDFDGFYLTLKQVDGVGASGSQLRVRDEMTIAAIVDKLLKDEYRFSLLPTSYEQQFAEFGIVLSDIGLDDGWLSVVYRNTRPNQQAAAPRGGSTTRR